MRYRLVASFHFLVDTDFHKYNIVPVLANDDTEYRYVAPDAREPLVVVSQSMHVSVCTYVG